MTETHGKNKSRARLIAEHTEGNSAKTVKRGASYMLEDIYPPLKKERFDFEDEKHKDQICDDEYNVRICCNDLLDNVVMFIKLKHEGDLLFSQMLVHFGNLEYGDVPPDKIIASMFGSHLEVLYKQFETLSELMGLGHLSGLEIINAEEFKWPPYIFDTKNITEFDIIEVNMQKIQLLKKLFEYASEEFEKINELENMQQTIPCIKGGMIHTINQIMFLHQSYQSPEEE